MTSQEKVANRAQRSESPPIVLLESEEIRKASSESESKWLTRAKILLLFFDVDASQWDKSKLIKWMLWKTALFIMMAGLGNYTVKTAWPIVLEYAESPTSYIPKTLFHESISLPPLNIYLPLSPYELDDYWASSEYLSSSESASHYQDLLAAYFDNKIITKETFLAKENQWHNYLLFVGYYYLSLFKEFEYQSVKLNWTMFSINFFNNPDSDLATAMNILEERMIRLNITLTEFTKKYGSMIKLLFNLVLVKNNQENSTMLEIEADYCWISFGSGIFFYFEHFDQYPIKDGETITIQGTRSELPNPRFDYDYQDLMGISIGGRPYYNQYDAAQFAYFDSLIKVALLQIASTYRMLPYYDGKQQCYENKSIDSCVSECWMDYYRKKCNCFPIFGHTDLLFNGSECYLKHYISCFNQENMFNTADREYNDLTNCEQSCLDICERTTYIMPSQSFYYYQKDYEMFKRANYSIIELRVSNFDYPIYEETPKWTFPSFIGALGGALGLWLGINVLDYIIYAATGIFFLIQRWKQKAVKETDRKSVSLIRRNKVKRRAWEDSTTTVWQRKITVTKFFFVFCIKIWTWKKLKKIAEIFLRIILGLLSLMIILLALKEYFSDKTVQIPDMKYNNSITLPNATVCLPLEFGELDYFSSLNNQGTNYTFILAEYSKMQNLDKETFVPYRYYWDNTVRNVVHAYLIEISNCESDDYSHCNRMFSNNDLVSAMNVLEIIIAKLNISVDELRQKFGKEVAALYDFTVSHNDFDILDAIIDINQTYIGYDQICYEMPLNLYPLNITSYLQIGMSEYSLPSPKWYGQDRVQISVDFENRLSMTMLNQKSTFTSSFGKITRYIIELTDYHSLREGNDGKALCSELTFEQCETVNRIKFIQKQCNCTPTSWPNLLKYINNALSDVCDMKRYNSCMSLNEIWYEEEGVHQCLRPCDRLTVTMRSSWWNEYNDWTAFHISVDSLNVLMFQEQLTWSFEKLLEIIGGIIGFLLGYSIYDMLCFIFLAFADFFTFIFKRLSLLLRRSTQTVDIEVNAAPNILVGSVESNAENLSYDRRFINMIQNLKKMKWKGKTIPWLLERVFKLMAIICFGYKTVELCIPIILQYKEGKTTSVINFVTNKSLTLKPATVCIEVNAKELDYHWMKLPNTKFEARIIKYFNQPNLTKESFLSSMKWTNTLISVIYSYLYVLTNIEMLDYQWRYDLTFPSEADSSLPQFFGTWGTDLYSAVILLETNINLLNISINDLRQRLGTEVAAIFSLNAYQTAYCHGRVFCQNDTEIRIGEVTAIHYDKICYQVRLDNYTFQNLGQRLILTANSSSLANKRINDSERDLQILLLAKNISDSDNRIMDDRYFVKTPFSLVTIHSIAVSAVFQSLDTLNRCSKYKTRENCMAECRVDLFRQMCNCTPTTWSNWVSLENYSECKLSYYTSCVNYSGIDDIPCIKQYCGVKAELCERWIFIVRWIADAYSDYGARLEVFIATFDYPVFKEQYELPFEEFIGALGGAIGFYLPLDFLAIFFLVSNAVVFVISLFTVINIHEHA